MSSTDSDEEIGKRIDQSSDEEYEKPKKKKSPPKEKKIKEKPPPKITEKIIEKPVEKPPPLPQSGRLNKARREEIIQNFNLGKEDPEYQCQKLSNGSYRVSKRKSYYSPTANVESNNGEIPMTWMNLQTQMNESLYNDMRKLRKKYAKLADKYEAKQAPPPPPEPVQPIPEPSPQTIPQQPRPAAVSWSCAKLRVAPPRG
jgi:hypothetical protein